MPKLLSASSVLVAVALSYLTLPAVAQNYRFDDLTASGGDRSSAVALNNRGQIVGNTNFSAAGAVFASEWVGLSAHALATPVPFQAVDINDLGQIAGNVGGLLGPLSSVGSTARAALLDQSGLTIFNGLQPQAQGSQAKGINNLGHVIGFAQTLTPYQGYPSSRTTHATLFSVGSTPIDLGTLGGTNSFGNAVNNLSQAVGLSTTTGDFNAVPTLWKNGTVTAIPGSFPWSANDINDHGQTVGNSFRDLTYLVPGADPILVQVATLFQPNGQAVFLDSTLNLSGASVATAVNEAGAAVGYLSQNAFGSNLTHGMLWQDGTAIDLNSFLSATLIGAGWYIKNANDINDAGWIVGDLFNSITGAQHGYLLSVAAVPEPSTYGLMIIGGALVVWRRKYRK